MYSVATICPSLQSDHAWQRYVSTTLPHFIQPLQRLCMVCDIKNIVSSGHGHVCAAVNYYIFFHHIRRSLRQTPLVRGDSTTSCGWLDMKDRTCVEDSHRLWHAWANYRRDIPKGRWQLYPLFNTHQILKRCVSVGQLLSAPVLTWSAAPKTKLYFCVISTACESWEMWDNVTNK